MLYLIQMISLQIHLGTCQSDTDEEWENAKWSAHGDDNGIVFFNVGQYVIFPASDIPGKMVAPRILSDQVKYNVLHCTTILHCCTCY